MKRDFQLPDEDVECLDALGIKWEAIKVGEVKWIIFHEYPIPEGYKVRSSDAALRIPPSYPDEQIDSACFSPSLELVNGKGIRNLTMIPVDGRQYQQWSRHRTPANPWRPGLDNIRSHLLLVDTWLKRELN